MKPSIEVVKTTSENSDFVFLIETFDTFLWERYPELKTDYWGNNLIEFNANVIIIYLNRKPVGCGCFKKYNDTTAELKRMFVSPEARGLGLAQLIIKELENQAKNQGFETFILETLYKQIEAINLYQKVGFEIVENYEPYVGLTNSVCMSKSI
ncbi:GNAT family N-acetyltransferase [Flavobacterium sp. ANB]|jgi:GNAT superfamily N-acetyltransferase|uniref:GNAT family N-acetyltransferase n=1 Tax=unclassified Flavobacterium TaxID=196869 RepID=UPI0012B7D1AB|nr:MULTISPECIES: GNAT family N-acetyltransferase [unclassified Flavobacterium]MBF4517699.1 GNAT family N-acetyltransferase [Flavobacterium sp. ANB]MTD70426.1 GNAT family N-acetyltransferase [Flavobacterium sp. LC2016-13]